jgi:phosphatidylserine/phosphatidylglycerophosphate/cardiolipin synthase-like enzyme
MPFVVTQGSPAESLISTGSLELVPRQCRLATYQKLSSVPTFRVTGDMIAYASPDSTYAVTRRLFDAARKEIIIGIYDFSADYMKEIVLNAIRRGVKVSLMLDIDSKDEQSLFDELTRFGCNGVPAPSCASDVISYFPSSHEKVIVIDGIWSLVQSGNYSNNSIPFNEEDGGDPDHFVTGNRDMGVAIRSKPLATFFANLLRRDMKLELDAETIEALGVAVKRKKAPDLVEAVPEDLPMQLFPSKTFNPSGTIRVRPILTPDNYLDVIPALLESATQSIYMEHQYIRSKQDEIIKLLTAIRNARARNPALDVRIILGKIFSTTDFRKEQDNIANLKQNFGLVLDQNIRYIDTKRFVHCHNKMIIVDGTDVLISSQNWSSTGVGNNREGGVLMHYRDIAQYYATIFESDWSTAQTKIPKPGAAAIGPEALTRGRFVKVVAADYQEV